jgi:hypothetical protein
LVEHVVQVIGSVEDEQCFSMFNFMKTKLRIQLIMDLQLVIQMFSQKFFTISLLEQQSKAGKTIEFVMGNDMEELLNFTISLLFAQSTLVWIC